jgi:hypothetical protein
MMTEHHATRGKYAHRAIELYCAGKLDLTTIDDVIKPYLDAFKKFISESGAKVHATEQMVYHPAYKYAGTYDLLISLPGEAPGFLTGAVLYLRPNKTYSWKLIKPLDWPEVQSEWIKAINEYRDLHHVEELWT